MASTSAPDPRDFRSWEEAFAYPLPVVRKLETQLRQRIDDDRTKLRTLVGASYRDLLGTAEKIIEMDGQIRRVETNLSGIGRRCNTQVLERAGVNSKALERLGREEETNRLRAVGQTRVLRVVLQVVARTTKGRGGDALLAAKLLVLARLLHKSVAEGDEEVAVLEEMRKKLGMLRKRLLSHIERELRKPKAEREVVINTLCAYAMLTSSAPKDVLRYFLQVRYEQLEARSEAAIEATLLDMLDLFGQTMLDVRELFPRRLIEALSQLSKAPLLQDEHITAVRELNLDVYGRWIADDVRAFIPWVRHDQLTTSEAAQGLASWAKQAQKSLVRGLETCLKGEDDVSAVLAIRRRVLSKYLFLSGRFHLDDFSGSIGELREVFLQRLEGLMEKVAELSHSVVVDVRATPSTKPTISSSIWSLATRNFDSNAGSAELRQAILQKRHGRDNTVQQRHEALDAWISKLNKSWTLLHEARSTKWDDELDFDLDDIDDGDEPLQRVLSRHDPERIERRLREATSKTLQAAYDGVRQSADSNQDAATLLRLLRELDESGRKLGDRAAPEGKETCADAVLVASLHERLAQEASKTAIDEFGRALQKRQPVSVALWDGSPALPVQVSPAAFRYLVELQRAMASAGEDLWSAAAMEVLKKHVDASLVQQLGRDAEADAAKDGEDIANEQEEASRRERALQRLFDTLYFSMVFLSASSEQSSRLRSHASQLRASLDIDDAAWQRLEKSAGEYWKRTYLLFGLLAPS